MSNASEQLSIRGGDAQHKMPWKLTPYKKNFILPFYYTASPDDEFYQHRNPNCSAMSNTEVKFQISMKYPILNNLMGNKNNLYVAYSQLSYWQAYQDSAFFRESNYAPEVFLRFRYNKNIFSWLMKKTDIGFLHESNGMGGDTERGWNRLYVTQYFYHGEWELDLTLWYRVFWLKSLGIHEYNTDISDYMGYGLFLIKKHIGKQTYSLEFRNQLTSGFSKGTEILTWSYRLKNNISIFLQGVSGYGQSLGEYNHYTNSIGLGFGFSH